MNVPLSAATSSARKIANHSCTCYRCLACDVVRVCQSHQRTQKPLRNVQDCYFVAHRFSPPPFATAYHVPNTHCEETNSTTNTFSLRRSTSCTWLSWLSVRCCVCDVERERSQPSHDIVYPAPAEYCAPPPWWVYPTDHGQELYAGTRRWAAEASRAVTSLPEFFGHRLQNVDDP